MIYSTPHSEFIISSGGVWLPGVYESVRAARYAFRFNDEILSSLQLEKNKTTKVITFKDLKERRANQLIDK